MAIRWLRAAIAALVAAPLIAVASPTPAAEPADVPVMKCIYLVKGVKKVGSIYVGDFAVLRRTGSAVRGDIGAFQSEYAKFRGSISGSNLSGRVYEDTNGDGDLESRPRTYTWVPSESRLKGWRRVSRATMRKYSGGGVPVARGTCGAATVSVGSQDGFLLVDVDPNKGSGYWTFRLQRRMSGAWRTVGTYRTRGASETRVLALDPGRYRVIVAAKHGWSRATSAAVAVD